MNWPLPMGIEPTSPGNQSGCSLAVELRGAYFPHARKSSFVNRKSKWSLWSDSHRRIRVYDTRPVAAEAQRRLIYDLRGALNFVCACTFRALVNRKSRIVNPNGALTWICTTSFRLRRAACRTDYTLRAFKGKLASVIGLAPIRPGLKARPLELLCIHGR
jgi:hypothetical protein